jgi:purine-cytosine permease-like protein
MQKFFQKHFHALRTTDNHWVRKTIGVLLVIGGMLGFLPVLGYWMLPLGLALLAVDFPLARRLHRRLIVWWEYRRRRWFGIAAAKPPRPARGQPAKPPR